MNQLRIGMLLFREGYGRMIMRGINAFARPGKPWILHGGEWSDQTLEALQTWRPDGLIAHVVDVGVMPRLTPFGVPVVNVAAAEENVELPTVRPDNIAAGEMAAEHLLERGYRHFGFFAAGVGRPFARLRERGFVQRLSERGLECSVYQRQVPMTAPWAEADEDFRRWLAELPRPVGIFCANDGFGRQLAEACHAAGLRVPDDVALLGADDDELTCQIVYPPLSSVRLPLEQIGYEAARLLEGLMEGGRAPSKPLELSPMGVKARGSTAAVVSSDPLVVTALRFIRENAHRPLSVQEVLGELNISRRGLEMKLRRAIGRTPQAEIRRVRLERARQLLMETDMSMPAVAKASGFKSGASFGVVFHRDTGETPTAFRRKFRIH
jgi:LacI family transcriptional regulator